MDDTELGHPNGKLLVASVSRVEDQTVSWAVHRFEGPFLFLDVEQEHVIFVVLPMARCLPELGVIHVRRDDWVVLSADASKERYVVLAFLVSSLVVLRLQV
jgi:hypothetical protein